MKVNMKTKSYIILGEDKALSKTKSAIKVLLQIKAPMHFIACPCLTILLLFLVST